MLPYIRDQMLELVTESLLVAMSYQQASFDHQAKLNRIAENMDQFRNVICWALNYIKQTKQTKTGIFSSHVEFCVGVRQGAASVCHT